MTNDGFIGDESSYTGLKLEVMGQATAERYEPGDDEVCISIWSAGAGVSLPFLSPKFKDILRLDFDDVGDTDDWFVDPHARNINNDQVADVVEFVLKHRNRKKMVIHCFAGMSRSRSMAAAIAYVFRLPYHFTINNRSVYSKVGQALREALKKDSQ